jgi:hypothetical protein
MAAILQRPRKPDARYGWLPAGRAAPKGRGGRNVSRFQVLPAFWYLISRTLSEQDVHRRNLDDRSVRAFAIKPRLRRAAVRHWGLTALRSRANPKSDRSSASVLTLQTARGGPNSELRRLGPQWVKLCTEGAACRGASEHAGSPGSSKVCPSRELPHPSGVSEHCRRCSFVPGL